MVELAVGLAREAAPTQPHATIEVHAVGGSIDVNVLEWSETGTVLALVSIDQAAPDHLS